MLVADEVERGRFWRGHQDGATRGVEALHRHVAQALANQEGDTNPSAGDREPSLLEEHLELLRALMRRAVILRGSEQAGVVRQAKVFISAGMN